jgi:hypothetical protein
MAKSSVLQPFERNVEKKRFRFLMVIMRILTLIQVIMMIFMIIPLLLTIMMIIMIMTMLMTIIMIKS